MPRGRPAKCPYCGSHATRPKGYRKTQSLGLRKLRLCTDCKRRFTLSKPADAKRAKKTKPIAVY